MRRSLPDAIERGARARNAGARGDAASSQAEAETREAGRGRERANQS